ncbi:B3 domain-containing protein REM3 [Brassica rapa]|uniref:B3 domain-containing protein REM3 n=1 Tax=Brassica campestris TaxID=3711 RepID=UPI0004F1B5D1|nr:B3 domain-containing protein REM3 [Brassica rapa]
MATSPKSNAPFFVISLAGHNSSPIIPNAFFATHIEGKNELTKLKLTSDACDTTWQVKLNGRRFADGWEDFSNAHCLRNDDVLLFREDGEMIFHVTPSGRSFSKIHYISSSSDDSEADETDDDDTDDDDDDDSEDDDGDDHGDETWDKVSDLRTRIKAESSSTENSCILGVTSSNLRLNRVALTKSFTKANGLHKSWCEINVINQSGKSWVMGLRHNKGTGQDYMRGGWRSFCRANKLKTGSFYRFELLRTGTSPALKLCSDNTSQRKCSKAKVSTNLNREGGERSSMNRSKFMTVTLKPYMLKSRQLHFQNSFARENGIKKGGKVNLVDKDGGRWPSCVASGYVNGGFYLAKGWVGCCKASGINTGDTFTLQFVREKGKTPMLQFVSKAKTKINSGTRFQKKARVSVEGEPSHRTHASHKSTVGTNNVECKQPLETISHQVRQGIVNVLADVRRFRSELEIKKQNLEAVLEEFDALGEKVSEINKFFK